MDIKKAIFYINIIVYVYIIPLVLDEWNVDGIFADILDLYISFGITVNTVLVAISFISLISLSVAQIIQAIKLCKNRKYVKLTFPVLIAVINLLIVSYVTEKLTGWPVCPFIERVINWPM